MAESTDKKTRKIAEKRVEPGKEFESYQEAQNQLLAIQAEQQQNLALQANDAMNIQQQNQTLAQAAEVMALDNLNPATQGILAGYGLNQPRVIKQSNTQRQGPNNITINNTTINNAAGPVQGREISIRPQEAGQSKFKAWLTNVFARQDAQWQKQNQEYARRESSLTRNSNKMMRKLEGLGKEIGNVIDPRKQAQRAQNSTMNLLKALGLVYFAKKLPDILNFFNNTEGKIRGWIGEIGDKIKGVFNITGKDGFFSGLIHDLYNEEETGVLNKLFKDIGNWISERAEYAKEKTGSLTGFLGLPDGEKILKWLEIFLGGPAASVSITRKKVLETIRENEFNDKASRAAEQQENWTGNYRLDTNFSGRFGVSRTDGGTTEASFSMGGDNEWAKWKKARGITSGTDKDASRFFREKGYAYTAEAYILLKSTWESKSGRVFSSKYDLTPFGTLPSNTVYPQLAASLEIIREYKKGVRTSDNKKGATSTNAIFYLLDLLMKKANSKGHVTVFEEFLKCIASDKIIPGLKKEGLIKEREYKLVMEPMTPEDQNRYMTSDRILMSNYYKKLVPIDGKNKEQALTLAEKDYRDISGAKKWTFIEISSEGLGKILEETTGSKTIDFDRDQKKSFMDSFRTNSRSINHGIDFGTNYFNYNDDSDEFQDFFEATQEKKDYDKARQEERERKESENKPSIVDGFLQFVGIKSKKIRVKEQEEFNKRRDTIVNYLTSDLGLDKSVAIGITGVLYNESGLNPAAVSRDGKTKKPNGGQGLAQWTSKRRKNFKNWYTSTKNKSYPTSDEEGVDGIVKIPLEEQLEFLGYELKNDYPKVYNKLKEIGQDSTLSEYDKIYRGTYIWMKDFEGGGVNEEDWPKVYSHTDKLGNRIPHYFEDSFKKRFESSLGLYEDISGTNLEISENTTTPSQTATPNTSPQNPNNTQKNGSGYRPAGTVGFTSELDEYSEVVSPTSVTPSTNFSADYSPDSNSLAMAENITPKEQGSNQSSENNSGILLARCAEGIDYIAKTMAPLSEVINSGNMLVAEAVSKSGQPTNLTPHEPQLEMNQV